MLYNLGKLDRNVTVEAMDTFNETLDIPRLDLQSHLSLPNISMTQEQAMVKYINVTIFPYYLISAPFQLLLYYFNRIVKESMIYITAIF